MKRCVGTLWVFCVLGALHLATPPGWSHELAFTIRDFNVSGPMAFSSDDRYMIGVQPSPMEKRPPDPGQLVVWDIVSNREVARIQEDREHDVRAMFVPGIPQVVLLGHPQDGISLWDFTTGDVRCIVPAAMQHRVVEPIAMSGDGKRFAFAEFVDEKSLVRIYELPAWTSVAEVNVGYWARSLAFGADSSRLVIAGERYDARKKQYSIYVDMCDAQTGEKAKQSGPFPMTGTRTRQNNPVYLGRYALSADGRVLATTLAVNGLLLIDLATGESQQVGPHPTTATLQSAAEGFFGGPLGTVLTSFAFQPNGHTLATSAHGSSEVHFWPLAGRAAEEKLEQPDMVYVRRLAFSPSGRLLAVSGSSDLPPRKTLVHVWRLGNE